MLDPVCLQHLPRGWTVDLSHAARSMSTLASQLETQKLVGSRVRIHDADGMLVGAGGIRHRAFACAPTCADFDVVVLCGQTRCMAAWVG